jgi:VIT1/CCC1 family predicted Fe2+/Mn2+ transporter
MTVRRRRITRGLVYVWAAPTTLVGLCAGGLTLATRGRVRRRAGTLEFHGGFARWLLERRVVGASAMTLGHVIIGRDVTCLDDCRDHELVHVRQVEVWGPLFFPAYVVASGWAWWRGGHYYLDNWFEVDARRRSGDDWLTVVPREKGPPMPQTAHIEKHFTAGARVRDIVIGMSDGLTVPFALAAGLTGNAQITTVIIVTAGLAEIAAGSIAMGLGGYLAARSDAEHYASERRREEDEVVHLPDVERHEVAEVFAAYGLTETEIQPILTAFEANHEHWVDFMMRYELGLEEPEPGRALASALTIAGSYAVGGLIPLAPYMILADKATALAVSVGLTLVALLVFGYVKGRFTGAPPVRSAWQTALIGGLAAAAAFLIARWFS